MTDLFCLRCIPRWIWALCAACFLASLWIGWKWYQPVPMHKESITIIFHVYDTMGNELKDAELETSAISSKQTVRDLDCQLTRQEGESHTLVFSYKHQPKPETVLWRTGDEFKQWLSTQFPAQLQQLDPNYDKAKWQSNLDSLNAGLTPNKYEYPVVFRL